MFAESCVRVKLDSESTYCCWANSTFSSSYYAILGEYYSLERIVVDVNSAVGGGACLNLGY